MFSNELSDKFRIHKHLLDSFTIQNDLEHGAASSFIFTFDLQFAIKTAQENKERLELTGAHQLRVCADHINLLGRNVCIS
jgi:hypothetical protein